MFWNTHVNGVSINLYKIMEYLKGETQGRCRYFFPRSKTDAFLDQFLNPHGTYRDEELAPRTRHLARTANSSAATCTKHR